MSNLEFPQQKKQENIEPKTEKERLLFEEIEFADEPIRTTLKRINRLIHDQFPNEEIDTTESCSGHVDSDGRLAHSKYMTHQPVIFFITRDEEGREKAINYIREVFIKAIENTNRNFNAEVIRYGRKGPADRKRTATGEYICRADIITTSGAYSAPAFACDFSVLDGQRAYEILKFFWDEVDNNISELDHLSIQSNRTKEAFYHK